MSFWINGYATVWQPEVEERRVKANLSTSRKGKDGEYINTNWFSVAFVGDAFEKAKSLSDKDRILVKSGNISSEPKTYDGVVKYFTNLAVFDFDLMVKDDEKASVSDMSAPATKKKPPTRPAKDTSFASVDDEEAF